MRSSAICQQPEVTVMGGHAWPLLPLQAAEDSAAWKEGGLWTGWRQSVSPAGGFLDLVCGQHMVPKDALKVSGKGPTEFTKMLTATVSGLAKGVFLTQAGLGRIPAVPSCHRPVHVNPSPWQ